MGSYQEVLLGLETWQRLCDLNFAMVWLMRINGESTPLPQGSFVIGRAASCNMACSDPAVSSTHCILFCDGPNLTVEDRSTNGTYMNGFRLPRRQSRKVVSGDKLALVKGAAEYLLEFADETSEVPGKLRKLSVLGDGEGLKVSASQVLAATLRRSQDVSLTYRDTELDSDVKDIPMKDADTPSEVTRIEGDVLQADSRPQGQVLPLQRGSPTADHRPSCGSATRRWTSMPTRRRCPAPTWGRLARRSRGDASGTWSGPRRSQGTSQGRPCCSG